MIQRVLPPARNPHSEKLHCLINYIQAHRSRYLQLQVVRSQMDAFLEVEFGNLLIEDKNLDCMSYVDFLCHVHRQIQVEINQNS